MNLSRLLICFVLATALSLPKNAFPAGSDTFVDDIAQKYTIVVAPFAYKALGGKTTSSWQRIATSNAVSAVALIGTIGGLKLAIDRTRPDGSDDRSFPSGHAGWTYMGASIIDYEAGWRSPLYSIGAYSIAAAISASRVIKKKHYPADVFAGAAIGISISRIGYFLNDWIIGKSMPTFTPISPSNSRLQIGMSTTLLFPLNTLSIPSYRGFSSAEIHSSIEFDMPLHKSINIGGGVGLRMRTISTTDENPVTEVEKRISPRAAIHYNKCLGNYLRLNVHADAGLAIDVSGFKGALSSRRVSPTGGITAGIEISSSTNATTGIFVGYDIVSNRYNCGNDNSHTISKAVSSIGVGFQTKWSF